MENIQNLIYLIYFYGKTSDILYIQYSSTMKSISKYLTDEYLLF